MKKYILSLKVLFTVTAFTTAFAFTAMASQPGNNGTIATSSSAARTELTDFMNSNEIAVLKLVNTQRINSGLIPLAVTQSIQGAADVRKSELSTLFSHTRPDGSSCYTALVGTGLPGTAYGENIASGQSTPVSVMSAWMNSSGHRANILSTNYGTIGIGYNNNKWVQVFSGSCTIDDIALQGDDNLSFPVGTSLDNMNLTLLCNCTRHGLGYIPVNSLMCTGYSSSQVGVQTVTIEYAGYAITVNITLTATGSGSSGSGESGSSSSSGSGSSSSSGSGGSGSSSSSGSGGSGSSSSSGSGGSGSSSAGHSSTSKGWKRDGIGWWYVVDSSGAYANNQWKLINNKWYYFDSVGYVTTGWQMIQDRWYYMTQEGAMETGWQFIQDRWYYLLDDGSMATGWIYTGNHWYYLETSGAMLAGTITPDGYTVDNTGAWIE